MDVLHVGHHDQLHKHVSEWATANGAQQPNATPCARRRISGGEGRSQTSGIGVGNRGRVPPGLKQRREAGGLPPDACNAQRSNKSPGGVAAQPHLRGAGEASPDAAEGLGTPVAGRAGAVSIRAGCVHEHRRIACSILRRSRARTANSERDGSRQLLRNSPEASGTRHTLAGIRELSPAPRQSVRDQRHAKRATSMGYTPCGLPTGLVNLSSMRTTGHRGSAVSRNLNCSPKRAI